MKSIFSTSIFTNSIWNKLVFESKNQSYGAFDLRKNFNNSQLTGLKYATIGFTLFILVVFFYISLKHKKSEHEQFAMISVKKVEEKYSKIKIEKKQYIKSIEIDLIEGYNFKIIPDLAWGKPETPTESPSQILTNAMLHFSLDPKTGKQIIPEKIASFPGGYGAIYSKILKSVKFKQTTSPKKYHYENGDDEIDYEINTMVFIKCEINENGKIDAVSLFKVASDPKFNMRILEAFQALPNWIPAINKGKKIRQTAIIPFHFHYKQPLIKYY